MYTLSLSKKAVHPASHNCPSDRSDPDANLLNKCTLRASNGNDGILSVAVCDACSVCPFGYLICIPLVVCCTSVKGRLTWTRCVSMPVFSFVNACIFAPLSTTIV